jgi:hypothetical protein
MTRFLGTPRIANTLCLGCLGSVVAWYAGEIPWWLALGAVFFIPTVRKAVQDVRRYDQWFAEWQGMGNASREVAPKRPAHRQGVFPGWVNVTLAVLSLGVILIFVASPATSEPVRRNLALFLLGFAVYLLCKTIVALRRRRLLRVAGTASAGGSKTVATEEVVRWTLPRAASSPSRTDAMRNVPDYCARLMAGQ